MIALCDVVLVNTQRIYPKNSIFAGLSQMPEGQPEIHPNVNEMLIEK
jgi:hypothetical protein